MVSVKKNFFYNSLYQLLILIVPIITTPYLTRTICADGIGTYSYSYSIANYFMMFILLGLENYGNREIAQHKDSKDSLSYTFCSVYLFQIFMGILVIAAYTVYILVFAKNPSIALIFAINILATCFDISWCLYGLELFKTIAIRNTLIKLLTTVLIFTFVKDRNGVIAYCLIMTVSNLISQLSVWPVVLTKIKPVRPKARDVFSHLKPNLFLFITVASVGVYKSLDKVMLGIIDPTKVQVGYFELAERIVSIPNILVVSLGTVMMPRIANLVSKKDESYTDMIMTSMFFSMFVSTSMSLGIMGVSKEFVPLFYGNGYEQCIYLYLVLLPCSFFMSFANVIRTQYILPNHMDKVFVKVGIYGCVLNICINLILIPRFGAIGAAFGTLSAEIFCCVYQSNSVKHYLPLREYIKYSLPLMLIGGVMFATIFFVDITQFTGSLVISLAVKIATGFIVYICGFGIYFYVLSRSKNPHSQHIVGFLRSYLPHKKVRLQ